MFRSPSSHSGGRAGQRSFFLLLKSAETELRDRRGRWTTGGRFNLDEATQDARLRPDGVSHLAISRLGSSRLTSPKTLAQKSEEARSKAANIKVLDAVKIETPHGPQRGLVVSLTANYAHVLTSAGTFIEPRHELTPCSLGVTFDWKRAGNLTPREGSVVTVSDTHKGCGEDGVRASNTRRILAEPMHTPDGRAKARVKVLTVRPGRNDAQVEEVDAVRVVGPFIPERLWDEEQKARSRKRPDAVKSKAQILRETTHLSFIRHLDPATQKALRTREEEWFRSNKSELSAISARVARRMMRPASDVPLLESEANLGALESMRAWTRNPRKQKAAFVANLCKRAAKQLGLQEGTTAFDSFTRKHAAQVKTHLSDNDLQSRAALAAAYRAASKRAFRLQGEAEDDTVSNNNLLDERQSATAGRKGARAARAKILLLGQWAGLSPRETFILHFGLEHDLTGARKIPLLALAQKLSEWPSADGRVRVTAQSAKAEWQGVLTKMTLAARAHGDSVSGWIEKDEAD